ncbi:DUF445 family protein [Alkalihalobacillus sp. MEB130]|uniref:DUF445 domain-containing protein n=1 Tax=Alkalihalobacillus sp. MEB130 TaxID=2976704 RepID=UPI0028DEB4D4|nr:DUF445 family protein [Alkalihalobacillus sp. MEB130]MDT8862041.1 DUF445 family protein [Alkalihalobacillus sp. MEB130]
MLLISFMVIIGAIIGGLTNSLAIKMLFRPYKEMRIGSWRVPFTPGLIPKRHDELAKQLGKMVVDYLLTAEGLGKKLKSQAFSTGIISWLQTEATKVMRSQDSISTLLEQRFGIMNSKERLVTKTELLVQKSYRQFIETNRMETLEKLVPNSIQEKIESHIPSVTNYILERGQSFLESAEGKEKLSQMIDRFLIQKGTLGNMISMFLGNDRLVDKVQPELVKFLTDEGTRTLVQQLLVQEWEKLKQKKLEDIEKNVNEEEMVSFLVRTAEKQIPLYSMIEQPLYEWTGAYEEYVTTTVIPKGVDVLLDLLSTHLEALLERFHLDDIVREQVQTFSVERLEELVLSISKREFKMITYLGAVLGGVIGFIQGFIILLIG